MVERAAAVPACLRTVDARRCTTKGHSGRATGSFSGCRLAPRDVGRRVRWSWVRPSSVSGLMDGVVRVERSGRQTIGDAEFDGLVKLRPPGERYFGCGERTAGLEKTGTRQVFWNVDPQEGHTASFNNLYTSIPFFVGLKGGRAHGVLFDNTYRSYFEMASQSKDGYY